VVLLLFILLRVLIFGSCLCYWWLLVRCCGRRLPSHLSGLFVVLVNSTLRGRLQGAKFRSTQIHSVVTYETPTLHLLVVYTVNIFVVFENISFLLFCAHDISELIFVLLQCVAWLWYYYLPSCNLIEIGPIKEWMSFDLISPILACTESLRRVSIK